MTLLFAVLLLAVLLVAGVGLWRLVQWTDLPPAQYTLLRVITVGLVLSVATGVILFWLAGRDRDTARDEWRTTSGTITEVRDLSITEPGASATWQFTFEYTVGGSYYIGSERRTAEDFAKGEQVTVYYDHDAPATAHLVEPDTTSDTARTLEITGGLLIVLGGLATGYVIAQIAGARRDPLVEPHTEA